MVFPTIPKANTRGYLSYTNNSAHHLVLLHGLHNKSHLMRQKWLTCGFLTDSETQVQTQGQALSVQTTIFALCLPWQRSAISNRPTNISMMKRQGLLTDIWSNLSRISTPLSIKIPLLSIYAAMGIKRTNQPYFCCQRGLSQLSFITLVRIPPPLFCGAASPNGHDGRWITLYAQLRSG